MNSTTIAYSINPIHPTATPAKRNEKEKENMKHVVKAISLTCDGCGQTFETLDGMTCYADDEDGKLVEETACNSDWKIMNGHHYCPSCWERDDDDIIHTKDGRKWDDSSIEVVEVREE